MRSATVIGGDFYRSLALPFVPDLLADQRVAGAMAWSLGEVSMLIVLVVFLVQWARSDPAEARPFDRIPEPGDGSELVTYNALLARSADRRAAGG